MSSTLLHPDLLPLDSTDLDRDILRVLLTVAESFGCPLARLFRPDRPVHVVHPRHAAMVLLREHLHLTFEHIGAIFHSHHATVMHARKAHASHLQNPLYAARFHAAAASLPPTTL